MNRWTSLNQLSFRVTKRYSKSKNYYHKKFNFTASSIPVRHTHTASVETDLLWNHRNVWLLLGFKNLKTRRSISSTTTTQKYCKNNINKKKRVGSSQIASNHADKSVTDYMVTNKKLKHKLVIISRNLVGRKLF